MNRKAHPNHELDRNPYWDLDEGSLSVIVKIRLNSDYFHQSADRCPKCDANCWEAEQPPIVFRGCACATMAFPPHVPLHERWEPDLWVEAVTQARHELSVQLQRELSSSAGGPN
jgi:hypothetical protein